MEHKRNVERSKVNSRFTIGRATSGTRLRLLQQTPRTAHQRGYLIIDQEPASWRVVDITGDSGGISEKRKILKSAWPGSLVVTNKLHFIYGLLCSSSPSSVSLCATAT